MGLWFGSERRWVRFGTDLDWIDRFKSMNIYGNMESTGWCCHAVKQGRPEYGISDIKVQGYASPRIAPVHPASGAPL